MEGIRTLAGRHLLEIPKIKGSRFWATVDHAPSVEAALALAQEVRSRWPDATHHCWAWRGDGRDAFRWSDDGEPSGSAGRPILNAIDGRDLTCVAVVVTRYFGGTRLGVGGLVRAYGGCAAETLDAAVVEFRPYTTQVQVDFDYGLSGAVQSVLTAHALEPTASEYGAAVRMTFIIPDARVDAFVRDLEERTAGRARVLRS